MNAYELTNRKNVHCDSVVAKNIDTANEHFEKKWSGNFRISGDDEYMDVVYD